jgi:predicted MPP superfamily phosphohydrolase
MQIILLLLQAKYTFSGILALDDAIRLIKVRYEDIEMKEREDVLFQNTEEKTILQEFSDYILAKNPDIIICMGDNYDKNNNNSKVLQHLFARSKKIGFNLQIGRDDNDDYSNTSQSLIQTSKIDKVKECPKLLFTFKFHFRVKQHPLFICL